MSELSDAEWALFWRNALVAEHRKKDAGAFAGKNKFRMSGQGPTEQTASVGTVMFWNGVMALVDQERDTVVLAAFPMWSGPTRSSATDAERSDLLSRARSVAKDNGVLLKELMGPSGRRELVYLKNLSMPEDRLLLSGGGSDFTNEGVAQIRSFANAVVIAADVFFADSNDFEAVSAYLDNVTEAFERRVGGSQPPSAQSPRSSPANPVPTRSSSGCYVATAVYGSYDCPQVWVLRRWRDQVLNATRPGRAFIRAYYAIGPRLVGSVGGKPWFSRLTRRPLDGLVGRLVRRGFDSSPYRDA